MTEMQCRVTPFVLSALAAVAPGCGPSAPGVDSAQFAYKGTQGEQLQASSLGGTWAVLPTGARLGNGAALAQVFVHQAELRGQRGAQTFTGPQLLNARLHAKSDVALPAPDLELVIRGVFPHGPAGEFEYAIDYRSLTIPRDPFRPLCPDGDRRALPVTGHWRADGDYSAPGATGQFSFACKTGVIAKCIDWGYKPWANFPAPPTPLRPYHQSCTRMARADYCSLGVSYTLQGTPIDLYDKLPINTKSPPDPEEPPYFIESIWRPEIEGRPALLCLSKRRWDTIPLGHACPQDLPDPRVDKRRGIYCEDRTFAQWQAFGAILANDSLFIDKGLFRWRKNGGEDHWTTTQYIYRGIQQSPTGPPPGGYSFAGSSGFEGAVYNEDLGAAGLLPPGVTLVPLFTYFSPTRGDHFTTSAGDPNGMPHPPWDGLPLDYSAPVFEGYIYAPTAAADKPHPRAELLFSFYSSSRREHVTSRTAPNPPMNNDFVQVRAEGWVLVKK